MRVLALAALLVPAVAAAHAGDARGDHAWVLVPILASLLAYARGLSRLWRQAGFGGGITPGQASAFVTASLLIVAALCPPFDAVADGLFLAHMVQHEVLMVIVAPLLVLARPFAAWMWALPPHGRAAAGRSVRAPALRTAWRALTHPLSAFLVHAAALWLWHVPFLFDAALRSAGIHALQHASFLLSAVLFWWAVLQPADLGRRDGVAVLSLFATMLHTGALGALLTISSTAWYPSATDPAWGIAALEDQQIGGLIMWIPAGTIYVLAALWLMARWIARSGTRTTAATAGVSAAGR